MKPVKVLLLVDSLTPEAGTENQIVELVRHMDPSRVELYVACMEDGARLQALARWATPWVFPAPGIFSVSGLRQAHRLRHLINSHQIDVVHTFMVRAAAFGVMAAYGSRCKAILTSRRNLGYNIGAKYRLLFKVLNRMTTRVLANSEQARSVSAANEGIDPSRIEVLYNGVDVPRFSVPRDPAVAVRWNLPQSAPIVGLVANLRPVKNQKLFLQAAQIVAAQVPEIVFVLAGRGEPEMVRELQSLAQDLQLKERVRWVDQEDVARLLPWLSIGCLSSSSESFSNSILEYMAAGLPVVATRVGGIGEAVEEGTTGLLVPSGDASAFAQALLQLLQDDALRRSMGERGRERCREHFSLEAAARRHADFYLSLVGQASSGYSE